jgi:hypothetical protein
MWENRVDLTATVITAGSENANLPAANVAHPHRTKVYRTGVSAAAEWIKFDFGSPKTVQSAILLDHTLTSGDSAIKVQANTTDSWTTPPIDQALSFNAGTIAHYFGAVETYRWWRVIFTKSAAGETRDIGRIFLGPLLEAERSFRFGSCGITPVDLSETDRSIGGQTFSEIKPVYDKVKGDFGFIGDTQNTQMKSLASACGTHTPWFLCIDDTNKPYELLYYGKTVDLSAFKIELIQSGVYLWSTSLEFAEEL